MVETMSTGLDPTIALIERDDGTWVAIDTATNVGGQGSTREQALEELDDAVALQTGEAGEPIEDEDAFLRDIGIDPDEVEPTEDLPDWLG